MDEHARIISQNLKRIAYDRGKTLTDISRDLNISKSTLSCWMNGARTPRMSNIDVLCAYFNVKRSEIMDEQKTVNLTPTELELLTIFREMNPDGQARLLERAQEMQFVPMYQKREISSGSENRKAP